MALCTILAAQPSTSGRIDGRVYNPSTGTFVRNAEVSIDGVDQTVLTESDGAFSLREVKPGVATIIIRYPGYQPVEEKVAIAAGETVRREFNLVNSTPGRTGGDGTIRLSAFTVSSEKEGNAKAIMEQRRNMNIVTSVSSDVFGDIIDGNVGEFIKYLPGVDIEYVESEARGPRLGGLDTQYVGVTFDGIRMASADAFRGGGENSRGTSFEGFSIASVESIEISRTTSADTDADSPAGTINMKTRRAFDRKGRTFNYTSGLTFNAEEFTWKRTGGPGQNPSHKWRPNLSLEYSESYFNQRLGILLGISRSDYFTENTAGSTIYDINPTTADPRPLVVTGLTLKDTPKFIVKDVIMFTADYKATDRLTLSLNAVYTKYDGEFWNRLLTFNAANGSSSPINGRSTVLGDGLNRIETRRTAANTRPDVTASGTAESKETYTRTFAPRFEYKLDRWIFDGALGFSQSVNDYESLEAGFAKSLYGTLGSDFVATRPHRESWEWSVQQTSGPDWFDLRNYTNNNSRTGGTTVDGSGRRWITELWNAQLNARWEVPWERMPVAVKFGAKWNEETRDNRNINDWLIYSYNGPGGNTTVYNPATQTHSITQFGHWANLGFVESYPFDLGTTNGLTVFNSSGQRGMPPLADRDMMEDLYRTSPHLFVPTGTAANYYASFIGNTRDLTQTVNAGYIQADSTITRKLKLRFGVRMEETTTESKEFDPRLRSEMAAAGFATDSAGRATSIAGLEYQFRSKPRVTREASYQNWFPSVLARYYIRPNLEFQVGANKAISRPPIDSLTGVWNILEDIQRVDAPNTALEPEHSKNYQARLSYYFTGRSPGQFSIGFGQNDIKNLRETFDFTALEFGVDDPEFANYTFRTTRNSTAERRFRSMDLSYNQALGFLPEVLRGTNVGFTYTRAYANARRNKLSPHVFTSRLGYAYGPFNGTIGLVNRDDAPDGNYGYFLGKSTMLDFSASWRFHRRLSLYVQGRNFTDQPTLWFQSPPGVKEGEQRSLQTMKHFGASWIFGIKGTF